MRQPGVDLYLSVFAFESEVGNGNNGPGQHGLLDLFNGWKREGAFFVRQFGHELTHTTGLPCGRGIMTYTPNTSIAIYL